MHIIIFRYLQHRYGNESLNYSEYMYIYSHEIIPEILTHLSASRRRDKY